MRERLHSTLAGGIYRTTLVSKSSLVNVCNVSFFEIDIQQTILLSVPLIDLNTVSSTKLNFLITHQTGNWLPSVTSIPEFNASPPCLIELPTTKNSDICWSRFEFGCWQRVVFSGSNIARMTRDTSWLSVRFLAWINDYLFTVTSAWSLSQSILRRPKGATSRSPSLSWFLSVCDIIELDATQPVKGHICEVNSSPFLLL